MIHLNFACPCFTLSFLCRCLSYHLAMDDDALRIVRNALYLGQFTQAMKDAKELVSNTEVGRYANIYYHRAMAHVNPTQLNALVTPKSETALRAIKQYANYIHAPADHRDMSIATMTEWIGDDHIKSDPTLIILAAHMYIAVGDYKQALPLVSNDAENLEKLALTVIIYLYIDRADLASKTLKAMSDLDDDDTLTQLCTVWTTLATSHNNMEKLNEADGILQGLNDAFGVSVVVHNAMGVCALLRHQYHDAFRSFKAARDLSVSNGTPITEESLSNTLVALNHRSRGESELIVKVLAELKEKWNEGEYVKRTKTLEDLFDKHSATYTWKA